MTEDELRAAARADLMRRWLYVGLRVAYILPDGPHLGDVRPALVTAVRDLPRGEVSLTVFTIGDADGSNYRQGTVTLPSVFYDYARTPGTWGWLGMRVPSWYGPGGEKRESDDPNWLLFWAHPRTRMVQQTLDAVFGVWMRLWSASQSRRIIKRQGEDG